MAELLRDKESLRRECMGLIKRNDALTLKLEVLERELWKERERSLHQQRQLVQLQEPLPWSGAAAKAFLNRNDLADWYVGRACETQDVESLAKPKDADHHIFDETTLSIPSIKSEPIGSDAESTPRDVDPGPAGLQLRRWKATKAIGASPPVTPSGIHSSPRGRSRTARKLSDEGDLPNTHGSSDGQAPQKMERQSARSLSVFASLPGYTRKACLTERSRAKAGGFSSATSVILSSESQTSPDKTPASQLFRCIQGDSLPGGSDTFFTTWGALPVKTPPALGSDTSFTTWRAVPVKAPPALGSDTSFTTWRALPVKAPPALGSDTSFTTWRALPVKAPPALKAAVVP